MLDAYIIEEIKKRDDDRRHKDDASRPRLHIDIPGWPKPGTDSVIPEDPRDSHEDEDEDDEGEEQPPRMIRIDL